MAGDPSMVERVHLYGVKPRYTLAVGRTQKQGVGESALCGVFS